MVEERNLPVADIKSSRFQGRRPRDVASLAASIRGNGLINPVHVWDSPDGLELLCGQRRLEAHKLLEEAEIHAKVHVDIDITEAASIHWSDNADRESLGYYEQSLTAGRILGWDGGEAKVDRKAFLKASGLSASHVKRLRRLYRLLPEVGELVDSRALTQKEGLEISRLPQDDQLPIAREYLSRISAENPESPSRDVAALKEMVADKLPKEEGESEPAGPRVLADEIGADAPSAPREPCEKGGDSPGEAPAPADQPGADLPDDDEPEKPAKGKRPGTETVEYGECHDRIRLVMNPKEWIVTVKVLREGEGTKPTQDIKAAFDKSEDDRGGLHLMLAYLDAAGKMAQEKACEATDG